MVKTDISENSLSNENEIEDMISAGEVFPGRPIIRPRVTFHERKEEEKSNSLSDKCAKYYQGARDHSPGLFTVQCICNYPKLFGISVMKKNESVATALSVIFSRFSRLPEVIYYDNACNLHKSVMLRCPWILKKTKLCCDRFHYKSHTSCGPYFDPDSYDHLRLDETSSAESINAQWATSRSHIRFLSGDNIVPFITVRAMFLNVKAYMREYHRTQDIDEYHLPDFIRDKFPCRCIGCSS